jgi:hypothetical protein
MYLVVLLHYKLYIKISKCVVCNFACPIDPTLPESLFSAENQLNQLANSILKMCGHRDGTQFPF